MAKYTRVVLLCLIMGANLLVFQNCGETQFSKNGSNQAVQSNAGGGGASVVSLSDLTVFEGEPVELEAEISQSASNPSFIWRKNGIILEGVGDATLSTNSAQTSDEGLYEVVYLDGSTELGRAEAQLTVIQQNFDSLPVITTQPKNMSIKTGDKLTLSVVASASPAPTYQWQKNGYDIPGATSATLSIAKSAIYDSGSYIVKVTNPAGTVKSKVASVAVSDKIVIPDKSCMQGKTKRPEGYSYTTRYGLYNSCIKTTTCIAGNWVVTGGSNTGQYSSTCR